MRDWFYELLLVWNYRSRSFWLFIIGIFGFLFIPSLIDSYLSGINLSGHMKGLEDALKHKAEHRVDRRALIFLVTSWVAAFKCYRIDKKKFLGRF